MSHFFLAGDSNFKIGFQLITDITDTLKLRQHDSEENVRFEVVLAIVGTAKKNFDIVAGSEELLNFVKVTLLATWQAFSLGF